jgi:prolyl oligopeptidase
MLLARRSALSLLLVLAACAGTTRSDGTVETIHGAAVADPYRWLEDGESAEVQAWADAQNARTRKILDPRPTRARLRGRLEELGSIGRLR